ncbi:MAG: DUF1295 domain-containing protein [Bacteroidetes bacterium]|nr:MAG: DUF1295 domain-containing protein [Bacteroidota bacterium]
MATLLYALGFTLGFNLLLYGFAYALQTDKLTDISYATTFALLAIGAFGLSAGHGPDWILLVWVLLWALRLGGYLFYRIQYMGRDTRFDEIRNKPWKFLGFWVMQGLTCGIVSLAFLLVMLTDTPQFRPLFWIGSAIALIGLAIESMADMQKFRFKRLHPDAFMQSGLWRRIRHPNYLGELLFWWGIFVASMSYVAVWPAILSPLWISMILLFFSGIPILEQKWEEKYGADPDFVTYRQQSWRLIPYLY